MSTTPRSDAQTVVDHRPWRDHASRWRRRVDLGRTARWSLRRPLPHRGVGVGAAGAVRRSRSGRPRRRSRPRRSAQARPHPAARAHRSARGVGGRRDARRRPRATRRQHRDRDRRRAHPARPVGHLPRVRAAAGQPAHHPDAHAQRPGSRRRPGDLGAGRRPHTGVGVCLWRRGRRPGPHHDPQRPRRHGRRRRHRGLHPPAAARSVRRHARALQAQRRPGSRVTPLGHRPRRLRLRRGRRGARHRDRRARQGSRRQDLRRGGRRGHHRRRAPHRPARPGGQGRDARHADAALADAGADADRRRAHQRARHEHAAGRRRRGVGHPHRARGRRPTASPSPRPSR